jgi:hypothetical protein
LDEEAVSEEEVEEEEDVVAEDEVAGCEDCEEVVTRVVVELVGRVGVV